MRFYNIAIEGAPATFKRLPNGAIWSSHPWGDDRRDPGAQQVEFRLEMPTPSSSAPGDNSTLVVKGVSWEQISKQSPLINKSITISAGMHKGLPLATHQARDPLPGVIVRHGQIIKAWGNWIRDEMSVGMTIAISGPQADAGPTGPGSTSTSPASPGSSAPAAPVSPGALNQTRIHSELTRLTQIGLRSIDRRPFPRGRMVVTPFAGGGLSGLSGALGGLSVGGFGTIGSMISNFTGGGFPGLSQPLNLVHDLQANMPLSSAIRQTLSKAFPNMNIKMNISPLLKLNYQDAGVYQNMTQYAQYIKKLSQSILGVKNYKGVHMTTDGKTVTVDDGTNLAVTQGQISPADLIGQPTWIDVIRIHFSTVLRHDIKVLDWVTLPPSILFTLTGDANIFGLPPQRTNDSFSGKFQIMKATHIGDYRNPDAAFWSSNFEAQSSDLGSGDGNVNQTSNNATATDQAQNPQTNPVGSATTSGPGSVEIGKPVIDSGS